MVPGVSLLDRLGRPPDRLGHSPAPCACIQRTKGTLVCLRSLETRFKKVPQIFFKPRIDARRSRA